MILFCDRFLSLSPVYKLLFLAVCFGLDLCLGDGEGETVAEIITGEEMVDIDAGSVYAFHVNDCSLDAFGLWGFLSSH